MRKEDDKEDDKEDEVMLSSDQIELRLWWSWDGVELRWCEVEMMWSWDDVEVDMMFSWDVWCWDDVEVEMMLKSWDDTGLRWCESDLETSSVTCSFASKLPLNHNFITINFYPGRVEPKKKNTSRMPAIHRKGAPGFIEIDEIAIGSYRSKSLNHSKSL